MKTATILPAAWAMESEPGQTQFVLPLADGWNAPELAGGKGMMLAQLFQAGLPVPDGFIIQPGAFDGSGLSLKAWRQVQAHLSRLRKENLWMAFAVRPSIVGDAAAQVTFAGVFETILNLKTDGQILAGIAKVYETRCNQRLSAPHLGGWVDPAPELAVVVQQLVLPSSSGILFTTNPNNEQRDQAVILAAWGSSEAVVNSLVAPDALVCDKETGWVLSRSTAVKQTMTALTANGNQVQPAPEDLRAAPVISHRAAAELVGLGVRIEALYRAPVEVEWSMTTRERVYLLNVRPLAR